MLKYLRIAVTALSLTACVLLIALWVRSYYWRDRIIGSFSPIIYVFNVNSHNGQLTYVALGSRPTNGGFKLQSMRSEEATRRDPVGTFQRNLTMGFGISVTRGAALLGVPHWFIAFLLAGCAILPWICGRFSLRTLLIATTLIAVGLGIIAVST